MPDLRDLDENYEMRPLRELGRHVQQPTEVPFHEDAFREIRKQVRKIDEHWPENGRVFTDDGAVDGSADGRFRQVPK